MESQFFPPWNISEKVTITSRASPGERNRLNALLSLAPSRTDITCWCSQCCLMWPQSTSSGKNRTDPWDLPWAWSKIASRMQSKVWPSGQVLIRLGAFALVLNFPRKGQFYSSFLFFLNHIAVPRFGLWLLIKDLTAMFLWISQQDHLFWGYHSLVSGDCDIQWVAKAQLEVESVLLNNSNLATAWAHTNYVSVSHLW